MTSASQWQLDLFRAAQGIREKSSILAYGFASRAYRWLRVGRRDRTVRIAGFVFRVHVTGELLPFWEVFLARNYEKAPGFAPVPGDVVFDIGANVGIFAIKQATRGAKVFAFEPNEQAYGRLIANVQSNQVQERVESFPFALGSSEGWGAIHTGTWSTTTRVDVGHGMDVRVRTVDAVVDELGLQKIDLMKIDVEGAEVAVLKGSRSALSIVQRIVLEFHSDALLGEVRGMLRSVGFREVRIADGYGYFSRQHSPEEVDRRPSRP